MHLAVFGDVHGNLPALELMLKDAGSVDGYICLGDTVDYGPWGDECVDLVGSLPRAAIVEGNHEAYFLRGCFGGRSQIAKAFFEFCYPRFTRFDAIAGLLAHYQVGRLMFTHTIGGRYIYADTQIELDADYIVGHSHRQFTISRPPFELHNPGSVGQNRQYINIIDYLLLDLETMTVRFRSLPYDDRVVVREMRQRGYPDICVRYYENRQRR